MMFSEWYETVVLLASNLGYSRKQVEIFKMDLKDHFNSGKTPEETVDIEF